MTTENKVFAANDPHLHITPDYDNGVARFAAAAIATHLFNLGRWNGVDTLVFQSDPLVLNELPIDLLKEGDEYTIEGVQTSLGAHGDLYDLLDDEPVSQETQEIAPVAPPDGWDTDGDPQPGGKAHPDPLPEGVAIEPGFATHSSDVPLDAGDPLPPVTPGVFLVGSTVRIVNAPGRKSMLEREMPEMLGAVGKIMTSQYRSDLDATLFVVRFRDILMRTQPEYSFYPDELVVLIGNLDPFDPDYLIPSTSTLPPVSECADPDFLTDFDDLTRSDFTPSAAAEQSRSDSQAVFDAALTELRRQLVDLAEQLDAALTVNRLQSDLLREIATPRKTRVEICTLVQNIDRYRAQADEALALCRNEGWQAVSYGYPQEPDGYHFRVVTLERTVPADLPEPDFKASHNGVGHMIVDAQPVPVGMAVPLSNGFGHPLEAW